MTETLGERIHRLRKEKHLSMDEVAKQMGYNTRSTICRLEKGEIDLQQQKIKKMAEILGVSPAYLVMREELDEPNTLTLNVKGIDSINISLNDAQGRSLRQEYQGLHRRSAEGDRRNQRAQRFTRWRGRKGP